jgi:hypothetical protein
MAPRYATVWLSASGKYFLSHEPTLPVGCHWGASRAWALHFSACFTVYHQLWEFQLLRGNAIANVERKRKLLVASPNSFAVLSTQCDSFRRRISPYTSSTQSHSSQGHWIGSETHAIIYLTSDVWLAMLSSQKLGFVYLLALPTFALNIFAIYQLQRFGDDIPFRNKVGILLFWAFFAIANHLVVPISIIRLN